MEEKQLHVLVEQSRSGDRAAQEELIAFVQNFVYYHCCKLLNDRESALDVTQEVLLAMVRGLPNLKEPAAFRAWLLKIICNRCRSYQTRGPKECKMPESPNGGTLLDTWAEESAEQLPEWALEESETAQLVRQLVDQLPTDQRACILLFYYDELTAREIAAALSVPMATVKTRLHRARKTLRTGLRRHGVSALALTALLSSAMRAEPSARLLPVLSASAKGATAGTVLKCAVGVAALGLIAGSLWTLWDFRKTKPPELEETVVGEITLPKPGKTAPAFTTEDMTFEGAPFFPTQEMTPEALDRRFGPVQDVVETPVHNFFWEKRVYDGITITCNYDPEWGTYEVAEIRYERTDLFYIRDIRVGDSLEKLLETFRNEAIAYAPEEIEGYYYGVALYGTAIHMGTFGVLEYQDDRPYDVMYQEDGVGVRFYLEEDCTIGSIEFFGGLWG